MRSGIRAWDPGLPGVVLVPWAAQMGICGCAQAPTRHILKGMDAASQPACRRLLSKPLTGRNDEGKQLLGERGRKDSVQAAVVPP